MTFCCICYDFTDIILCIESAIRLRILCTCKRISETLPFMICFSDPPCHMVCKIRVCINLKSPSRSISKVKMHHIHSQKRQCINLLLDEILTLKTSGLIYHYTSVLETRIIENSTANQFLIKKTHHLKSLLRTENSLLSQSKNLDAFLADNKFIGLLSCKFWKILDFSNKVRGT